MWGGGRSGWAVGRTGGGSASTAKNAGIAMQLRLSLSLSHSLFTSLFLTLNISLFTSLSPTLNLSLSFLSFSSNETHM